MKFGLAGFAGSGKTTLFNAMTGLDVPAGFGGRVRIGTVQVPDPRVDVLSRIFSPPQDDPRDDQLPRCAGRARCGETGSFAGNPATDP